MFCFGVASNCNIGIGNLQNESNAYQYNGTSLAMEMTYSPDHLRLTVYYKHGSESPSNR